MRTPNETHRSVIADPCPLTPASGLLELLSAGKTSIDLVPVAHFRLAVAPAQIDLVIVHPAGKVDQAGERVLQLDPQPAQLREELGHLLLVALQISLHLPQLFGVGIVAAFLAAAGFAEPL